MDKVIINNHKVCFVAGWLVCTHYICVLLQLMCCVTELTGVFIFCVAPFCRGQLKKEESLRTTGEWRKPTEVPCQAVWVLPVKMVSSVKVWGPTVHTHWNLFLLTFRHRASCILGQAFHCSPENAFYIFNQQIYFIIWYLLDHASLI